jgi:hypothetical protein
VALSFVIGTIDQPCQHGPLTAKKPIPQIDAPIIPWIALFVKFFTIEFAETIKRRPVGLGEGRVRSATAIVEAVERISAKP